MSKTTTIEQQTNKHNYDLDQAARKQAQKMVTMAKVQMMSKMKFYATLALGMQVKWCNIGTMGTDGKDLYIDPNFVVGYSDEYIAAQEAEYDLKAAAGMISPEDLKKAKKGLRIWGAPKTVNELIFVISHEVKHCVDSTMARGKGLDHGTMNRASDYAINAGLCFDLCRGDISQMHKDYPITSQCLLDKKYFSVADSKADIWLTEKIYLDLLKEDQKGEGGGGSGEGQSFDEHMEISEEQAQKIKESMIGAASRMKPGDMPGDVQKMVDDWNKPKVSWTKILDRDVKNQIVDDYTYAVPATRSWPTTGMLQSTGMLTPDQYFIAPSTTTQDTIDLMCAPDASGSIFCDPEVLKGILGEIGGIVKQFRNCKLTMCSWDTKIHNVQEYTSTSIRDLKEYKLEGGGGSDLTCLGNYLEEQGRVINQLVVFTDLAITCDWEQLDKWAKKIIFVVFDAGGKVAPIGTTINYDDI